MPKELTIPLTYARLSELKRLLADMLEHWEPENTLEHLLYNHAQELLMEIKVKIDKEVKNPRLVLKGSQVWAFWMLWQLVELTGNDLHLKVVVDEVVAIVDKYVKHPANRVQKNHFKTT